MQIEIAYYVKQVQRIWLYQSLGLLGQTPILLLRKALHPAGEPKAPRI